MTFNRSDARAALRADGITGNLGEYDLAVIEDSIRKAMVAYAGVDSPVTTRRSIKLAAELDGWTIPAVRIVATGTTDGGDSA